jgi:2-oxoglutarate-Fe(II)-dependent oxygenase superfamily protein
MARASGAAGMIWDDETGIGTIEDILNAAECAEHIDRSERAGFGAAPIISGYREVFAEAVRNNTRVIVDDFALAALVWERARRRLPIFLDGRQAIAMNERFRYYRYRPGQRFNWHADAPFFRSNGEVSQLSFITYLNDDFAGGETAVMKSVITPKRGMALFFLHELLHEGRAVTVGTKYVMRTDVMYGRVGETRG